MKTADDFADGLTALSQTFSYIYADYGKLAAVADGLLHDNPAWDVSAQDAGQIATAESNAMKLSYYRALVSVSYQRVEAGGVPKNLDLQHWCLFKSAVCETAYLFGWVQEWVPDPKVKSNAYVFPVPAPGLNFQDANDHILISVNTGTLPSSVHAMTPELVDKMRESGLFVPYLYLRWPMFPGANCPAAMQIQSSSGPPTNTVFQCTQGVAATEALEITTQHLPAATQGMQYHAALKATGSVTNKYHWTVQSGSQLPAGLTLSTKGVLSGAPTTHGKFPIRVTVNGTASAALTLTIHPPKHTLANTGVPTLPLLILAGVLIVAGVLLTARRRNAVHRSSGS